MVDLEDLGQRLPQVLVLNHVERLGFVTRSDRPTAQVPVEVGIEDERRTVDHGHDGVKVHERVAVRKFDRDDPGGQTGLEEPSRQDLDRNRRRALAHADHDGAVSEDVHVATFDGRLVVDHLGVEQDVELLVLEDRVIAVDRPRVQRLALARGLSHGVDRDATVNPARIVTLEERVR